MPNGGNTIIREAPQLRLSAVLNDIYSFFVHNDPPSSCSIRDSLGRWGELVLVFSLEDHQHPDQHFSEVFFLIADGAELRVYPRRPGRDAMGLKIIFFARKLYT